MSYAPAISDADLARMLAHACPAPAMPDGLADRIMAALPPEVPELPPVAAPRRAARRWLRPGLAIAASLVLGSAVAASLANLPPLRQVLAPVLERMGLARSAAPAPPRPARPPAPAIAPAPAPAPPVAATLPAAPARITATLPTPPVAELPHLAPPPPVALPPRPPAIARPDRPAPAAAIRRERLPDMAIAPPAPALPPELPTMARDAATAPAMARTDAPDVATQRAQIAEQLAETATPGAARPVTPAGQAETLQALRQARQNGTLTPDQARQLRTLQALRAARSARAARTGTARQ